MRFHLFFSSLVFFSAHIQAMHIPVTNIDIDGANGLREAINFVNALPADSGAQTITIDPSLAGKTFVWPSHSMNLPPFMLNAGVSVTIHGPTPSVTLDGTAGASNIPPFRGFIVESGNVTIDNMHLSNLIAKGGDGGNGGGGGGGGIGAGGACFVAEGASLTLDTISFATNKAIGGNGGNVTAFQDPGGGGGGMGGQGGHGFNVNTNEGCGGGGGGLFGAGGSNKNTARGGAGGGGLFFPGGISANDSSCAGGGGGGSISAGGNSTGGIGGAGGGLDRSAEGISVGISGAHGGLGIGGGGGGCDISTFGAGGNGGPNGGGGGGAYNADGGNGGRNGGGGSSGYSASRLSATAGSGGYGGGGAGCSVAAVTPVNFPGISTGGFGGGGGGAAYAFGPVLGAPGGFGGGGGGGVDGGEGGVSAHFGGNGGGGSIGIAGGGGGGAALGGTLFVQSGGMLTIGDNAFLAQSGTLTAGNGGAGRNSGDPGSAFGKDLFLNAGGSFIYNSPLGSTFTLTNLDDGGDASVAGCGVFLPAGNRGTLVLAGKGSSKIHFQGNVSVSGGTLEIAGNTSTFTSAIANNAALTFMNVPSSTFSGTISGTGTVRVSTPSHTLTYGGNNTYSGETSVTHGTLSASVNHAFSPHSSHAISSGATLALNNTTQAIAGLNGAGLVDLGSGQLTVASTAVDDTYSGTITGTGKLIKSGDAKFFLTGGVNLKGEASAITIQSGQMYVMGSADAHAFTVASQATLRGTGSITVGEPLRVLGTVFPGASQGTFVSQGILSVNNDVSFAEDSTLRIQISPGASDQLNVTGTADVTGATLVVTPLAGVYIDGIVHDIVVAGNVITPFAAVDIPSLSSSFRLSLNYSLPHVIQLMIESFPSIVPNGNAGAVASAFSQLDPSNPDVAKLMAFFNTTSNAELQCDFDQMHPGLFNAVPIVMESAMTAVRKTLSTRMKEMHTTKCKAIEMPSSVTDVSLIPEESIETSAVPQPENSEEVTPFVKQRKWGIWIAPLGNFDRQRSRSQHGQCDQTKIGFDASTYGTALGLDGPLGEHFALGGAVFYANTQLHWEKSQAFSHANSLFASLFTSWFNRGWYIDLAVIGAYDWMEARRRILLTNMTSTIKRHAKHDNQAKEYDVHFGMGTSFNPKGCWQLRPFLTVDYIYIHEGDYSENGAGSIDLKVESKNSNLLRDEIGMSIAYARDSENFSFSPEWKLSYVREDRFDGKDTHAQFVNSNAGFEVSGFKPTRNLISPGFSLTFFFPAKHFSAEFSYNGEFGSHWYNQIASAELLYRF